ncbi:uncharacterized protein LOC130636269 isoform X2 [Hydractinia symbiolongicarpus]|uniref:uncharacterized protein LOC130636269 isoform X2 n=1 Tax=Hydractinia symbiolongicarpus TaxID=13093 RepID=UPI00254A7F91|nr:uncharacterized protein LOC130636269 isoform X2 [Hydractinia symbiolongicarpus]XP_057301919.1 uncharacterized protein LOC130636269 isoform X2 [Hydractinia symbiolongicarpus]
MRFTRKVVHLGMLLWLTVSCTNASTNDTRPTTVHDLNGLLATLGIDKKEILEREKLFKKFREINTKNITHAKRIATTRAPKEPLTVSVLSDSTIKVKIKSIPGADIYKVKVKNSIKEKLYIFKNINVKTEEKTVLFRNLKTGYNYTLSICHFQNGVAGPWSVPTTIYLPGGRPPLKIFIDNVTDTGVRIQWKSAYVSKTQEKQIIYFIQVKGLDTHNKNTTLEYIITHPKEEVFTSNALTESSNYVVKIKAMLKGENITASFIEKTFQTKKAPPAAPVIIKIILRRKNAHLSWTSIHGRTDVKKYQILCESLNNTEREMFAVNVSKSRDQIYIMKYFTEWNWYKVKVRGIVNGYNLSYSYSNWSAYYTFQFTAPLQPITSIHLHEISSAFVIIKWQSSNRTDILRYQMRLRSHSMNKMIKINKHISNFKLHRLTPNTSYEYQIQMVAKYGRKTLWSPIKRFYTDSNHLVPAPSIVTVTYTDIKDVTVVWKRVSNYFKHYELCISSADTKIEQYFTSNTFYKLDFLKHDITYHAKVRGIIVERNLSRVYGKWSNVKIFSLKTLNQKMTSVTWQMTASYYLTFLMLFLLIYC